MGSSAKKKKVKKQDFQKARLRVGKPKDKAANFTDTTFAARSIHLRPQSISTAAPTTASQISHHVALLKNRAASQRHDSLAYLTNLAGPVLADAAPEIIPRLPTLLHDESNAVRGQTLKLLRRFPVEALHAQVEQLLLWTRAGLTHLSVGVRVSALDVLDWLLEVVGETVVGAKGAWVGYLRALTTVVGWKSQQQSQGRSGGSGAMDQDEDRKGWSNYQKQGVRLGSEGKVLARQLGSMASFIEAGLRPPQRGPADPDAEASALFPYPHMQQHAIARRANAYAHLNLFGAPADEENQIYESREDRQRVFHELFEQAVRAGVEEVKKEGGELGRAASRLQKAVDGGMAETSL